MTMFFRFAVRPFMAVMLLVAATSVSAQSAFSPAILVNDGIITHHEIEQRAKLLQIIGGSVAPRQESIDQLIEDRLKLQAGRVLGFMPSEDAVQTGMEEFAKRGNMTSEQLIAALATEGVAEEALRDFVTSGLIWRGVVQALFSGRVQVSDRDVDRAISSGNGAGGIRVLLSEIIIPVTPQTEDQVMAVANQISRLKSQEEFAQAALRYSASGSRENGGKLEWLPITEVPGPLRPQIMSLSSGEISNPLRLQGAIAVFQLRGIAEATPRATTYTAFDYSVFLIPGGRTEQNLAFAAKLHDRIDRCDDLYKVNFGKADEFLNRESLPPAEIPTRIKRELDQLDPGEVSTALTTEDGQSLIFLMLCGRTAKFEEDLGREDVLQALQNQRLESFANGYLSQLKAEATIEYK